jgi:hypothetical protein
MSVFKLIDINFKFLLPSTSTLNNFHNYQLHESERPGVNRDPRVGALAYVLVAQYGCQAATNALQLLVVLLKKIDNMSCFFNL